MLRPALALAAALLAVPAGAQDRPTEDELFGAPAQEAPPKPEAPPTVEEGRAQGPPDEAAPERAGGPGGREALSPSKGRVSPRLDVRDDTLRVGGQLYLRAATSALEDQDAEDWRLSSANLLDVYLDARPNERVRGFVLGRLFYDPTLLPEGAASASPLGGGALDASAIFRRSAANPRASLDQLWVNFDVERRAFVTVGRQHAKWGVGRFWNPTDYLHPVRRDPLAVFDERVGTTMLKLHVPWEARGWNFYAVTILEDVAGDLPRTGGGTADPLDDGPDGTNRLGRIGAGARAEIVLGPMELGLDAVVQAGHRPRFGVDVSAGVWDLDVYAEAALRTSVDTPRWRERAAPPTADLLDRYERDHRLGFTPQVVAGATYAAMYSDEDVVSFGAEYFYDRSGYESPRIYPALLGVAALAPLEVAPEQVRGQPNPFSPFYLGRHYGGAFVSLPAPGRWNDTTFTLSVLGNLSDKSFVARLDHSVLALTYLRVETFVAGHFGTPEGEFRLGFALPAGTVGGLPFPGARTPPQVLDAGVAIRVSL